MKFLLTAINAKYIHSNPAIYSLKAYAGEMLGQYVELAEYTINQSMGEILADIYRRQPDIIGFSCYIWNWRLVQELLDELPKLLPKVKLWLGGPEATYDADVILRKRPWVTGVMVGEGEETFKELLEYYVGSERTPERASLSYTAPEGTGADEEKGLGGIPGLCLPDGYTARRALMDMNRIPFLYEDMRAFENRIVYYESSRGCPFDCSYCLSSVERQVRVRDIGVVKRELQFFLDNQVRQVKFVDRTFNCNHAHAMDIWRYIHEHDNGVTNFHFEISADLLQEDELALLGEMRPGLVQLEIGVQSANPETLAAISRRSDLERLERAVAAVRRGRNIHQHLDLIAGLPYEDYGSFGLSFDRVYRMRPDQLQLGFLKVLKGSKMHEKAGEYEIRCLEQPPYEVLCTRWLSYEDVLRLKRIEEMVEIYYNSMQFTHTLPFLETAFSGPFAMFEALGDFYRERGYFAASPARSHRYGILLDFAAKRDGDRLAIYKELLTYDLYLRENLKSRPEFAPDLRSYQDEIREFYVREAAERRFLKDYGGFDWKQLSRMTHLEPFAYPVWDMPRMLEEYGYKSREQAAPRDAALKGTALIGTTLKGTALKETPLKGTALKETASAEAEAIGSGKEGIGRQGGFVLFDYMKRSPLNYEARVWPVPSFGEA